MKGSPHKRYNWDIPKIQKAAQDVLKEQLKGTGGQHISNLRQWLNEDRITDPNKMVSNEDILYWLDGYKQQVINEYLLEAKNVLNIK